MAAGEEELKERGPRDFSFDELMQPGNDKLFKEPTEVLAKVDDNVASNNPNYQPPEMQTLGLNDGHAELERWKVRERPDNSALYKRLDMSVNGITSRFLTSYMIPVV